MEQLQYQKLLEIIRKLPDNDAEYVLRFVTSSEKKAITQVQKNRLIEKELKDEKERLMEKTSRVAQKCNEYDKLGSDLRKQYQARFGQAIDTGYKGRGKLTEAIHKLNRLLFYAESGTLVVPLDIQQEIAKTILDVQDFLKSQYELAEKAHAFDRSEATC